MIGGAYVSKGWDNQGQILSPCLKHRNTGEDELLLNVWRARSSHSMAKNIRFENYFITYECFPFRLLLRVSLSEGL